MNFSDQAARDLITVNDPNLSLEVRVAAGARLWDLIKRAKAALEPLKDVLRLEARSKIEGTGTVTLEGTGMTRAMVTIPESSLQIVKNTDMDALKKVLGSAFDSIFEENVTYKCRSNATAHIRNLPRKEQSTVLAVVREDEGKPRVSFQFAGSDILDPHSDSKE
jgi:hypothetical protein